MSYFQNILKSSNGFVIADFGMSNEFQKNMLENSTAGTMGYLYIEQMDNK